MLRRNGGPMWAMILGAAGACVALAACTSSSSSTAAQSSSTAGSSSNLVFYEVNNGCASDPFWAAVDNGGNQAAKDFGVSVRIVHPLDCESQAEENSLLTTVVNSHPAGIAISETSATAFASNIQRARQLGIPVIAYNSIPPNNNPTQDPVQGFVGTDLYQSGVEWAKEAISEFGLKSGDTVPNVDACVTNIACETIASGFDSVTKPLGIASPIIVVPVAVAQATSTVHAYIAEHPNIKAIISEAGDGTAVVAALQEAGKKPGQIGYAGYNLDGKMPQYMAQGWESFTIDQGPFLQGFDAIADLYTAAKYGQIPVSIPTGPEVVKASDKALLTSSMVANTGY